MMPCLSHTPRAAILTLLGLIVPVGFVPAAEPNAKPNMVVILADDRD
jgi:hypothetical protein